MGRTSPEKDLNLYNMLQKKMKTVEKSKKSASKSSSSNSTDKKKDKEDTPEKETKKPSKAVKQDVYLNPDEPDRTFGDFHCKICDSHMNSNDMWIAHVTGKRHMKNVMKGDKESKYEDLDEDSTVLQELENVKIPVIGLDYIHEIRRREPGVPPIYSCFLCQSSISTAPLVITHVTASKHRFNVLRENAPDEYKLIEKTNLKKTFKDSLIEEKAMQFEGKHGRGEVKVKQEKPKTPYNPHKRSYDSDDDERPESKSSRSKTNDRAPSVWKSIDVSKKSYRDELDNHRSKNYYEHDNKLEDGYRSHSYRDRHSQDQEREDYLQYYSRKPYDYLRSVSPRTHSFDHSAERDLPSRGRVLHDEYNPKEFSDDRLYLDTRPENRVNQGSVSSTLPSSSISSMPSESERDFGKFMILLSKLPNKHFLKVCVAKLTKWTSFYLDEEDLCHFRTISRLCGTIVEMSNETKKGNMQGNPMMLQPLCQPPGQLSSQRQQNSPTSSNFIMDIDNLLTVARRSSELTSSNHNQTTSRRKNVSVTNSNVSQSHTATSSPTNFLPPVNNFPTQPNNFPTSANNFPQTPANDFPQTASNNFHQTPSNNFPQTPANNFSQTPANSFSQTPANSFSQTSANNYTFSQTPANNFSQTPANNFSQTSANNFPQTSANNFTSSINTLPHSDNFASKGNNYTSSNKTSPSHATYSAHHANSKCSIPGLTLTENTTSQNSPQNEYTSPYYWSASNSSRGESFKRY